MHFFSPANVMPLLEVVRTDEHLAGGDPHRAWTWRRPLRKTPVLARVCYGFIGNRMMEGYAREAERMVLEGATPRQVDTALEKLGHGDGHPRRVRHGRRRRRRQRAQGQRRHAIRPTRPTTRPTSRCTTAGRLGQKNGKGYYRYEPGDRTRHDDPEALAILRAARARARRRAAHSTRDAGDPRALPVSADQRGLPHPRGRHRACAPSDIDVVWTRGLRLPALSRRPDVLRRHHRPEDAARRHA